MTQFILVYTHPTEGEYRFDLVPNRSYRIGSRADNDIVIDQKDVSRRHALLRVQDGSFHITDLDSKNGTFINGAKAVSETFNCGDMVHLSSARLVIVELGTGSYPSNPELAAQLEDDSGASTREETQKLRNEATLEDVVTLLETTAVAVQRGALADPLTWSVDHLGFEGAVVLYRDENDSVAMVSSAGDLGQLARKGGVLAKLATDHEVTSAAGTRVRQVTELGENLLVATVGTDHVLVVRYAGRPPAIADLRSIIAAVNAVLASGRVRRQGSPPAAVPSKESKADFLNDILGLAPATVAFKSEIADAARGTGPVVVAGDRGSGCSAAARKIHDLSSRAEGPYVEIDLDGVDSEAIVDRLLGEGAEQSPVIGAAGGSLVLDRVGEMPLAAWRELTEAVAGAGDDPPRPILVLNADASSELADEVKTAEDLRLVAVPPLAERRQDIPILVFAFAAGNDRGDDSPVAFTGEALEILSGHSWPGNIAELQLEVEKAVAKAHPGDMVEPEHLSIVGLEPDPESHDRSDLDLQALENLELAEARNLFEEWIIRRALDASGGKQTETAERLGLSRAGLFKKMRKLGL
jgi:DNA-binding NtrC family response regulator